MTKSPHLLEMNGRSTAPLVSKGIFLLGLLFLLVTSLAESFLLTFPKTYNHHRYRTTTIIDPTRTASESASALFAKSGTKKKKTKDGTICVNRQARRNYEILETLEAGISLLGTEVKAIRDGKMNLQDAYVKTSYDGRSCTLMNCHIGKHSMSGAYFQHEERRERPLLVRKQQALKFKQKTEQKGMTIVALKAYFNDDNNIKLTIAICRGKNVRDKRDTIKQRDGEREDRRTIKNFRL
jgi:SsrA-binding protein